ncbi:unnamed protein product [Cladocopium goreaui]|uniref:Protein DPCD n=1 Tax=Cladocopium goreaui TaxID=2562237 RepID=A0A9P1DS31_9DINO|nr:unnamed protein product [Cladocopium goreaui]
MPIDYSKFDNIGDSDEEPQPSGVAGVGAANRIGRNGREVLEAGGLEEKFTMLPGNHAPGAGYPGHPGHRDSPEMTALAAELERLAGPGGPGGKGMATQEPPKPGEPQRVCMKSDGRKKIHTTFPDGGEMVEEYDDKTDVLMVRKVRKPTKVGKEGDWVFEVGQATEAAFDPYSDVMRASTSNPIFLRKDTPEHFQWRIRNLPYPADVYSVLVDHEKQEIVVKTSNKKYYKRIQVPDLLRYDLKFQDELLSWKHQHSTLIISYRKPPKIVAGEQEALRDAEKSAMKM